MAAIKAQGIVIAESSAGESDRRVTVLAKNKGKLAAFAKGARKVGSKFLAGTQLFTYADFVFYDGKTFYALNSVNIIQNFYDLRNDYERFCMASYFVELTDALTVYGEQADDILMLTLIALARLSRFCDAPASERAVFELKALQLAGLSPERLFDGVGDGAMRQAVFNTLKSGLKEAFNLMPEHAAQGALIITKKVIEQNIENIKSLKFL